MYKRLYLSGKLGDGKFATVDENDYNRLSEFDWYLKSSGYACRSDYSNGYPWKTIRMHRAIVNAPDNMQVDHINGDKLDNRKNNLRICTPTQNNRNRRKSENTTSKYKGVYWRPYKNNSGKWQAQIRVNSKTIYLGIYLEEKDAALAYIKAASKIFGEFFRER